MKRLFLFLMILNTCFVSGQNVIAVKRIALSNEFNETVKKVILYRDSSIYKKIEILEKGLITSKSQYEKYRIIVNTLGAYYTFTKQYDKAIDLWIASNKEGMFFPFGLKEKDYLPYLQEYSNNKRFLDFLVMNDTLRNRANVFSKAEYFVNLPVNYNEKVKYPLIFIFYGGYGNNNSVFYDWESNIIKNEFISVYPRGKEMAGSYSSHFGQTGISDMKEIYRQVIQKYAVDTSKVILAGQSLGGDLAMRIAYSNFPTCGLMLAFPVKPEDFDYKKANELKKRNCKIVMLCGEKDFECFPGQQVMSNIFDSAKVEHRFVKYPDLGHTFPIDFSEQLVNGIQYLMKNK